MSFYNVSKSCQIPDLANIYEKYFGILDEGVFVDVGAYDGITFSNTSCFVEAGWSGLMFEPLRILYEKCEQRYLKKYSKVTTRKMALGSEEKIVDLFIVNPAGALATTNKYVADNALWGEEYTSIDSVMCSTLNTQLGKFKIPVGFEFISIDTEGSELDVLTGFTLDYWRPQMAIIETHALNVREDYKFQNEAINKIMALAKYKIIFADTVNTIFVPEEGLYGISVEET